MDILLYILLILLPLYFGLFRNNLVYEYRSKVLWGDGVEAHNKLPSYGRMVIDFVNWSDLKLYRRSI